MVPHKQIFRTSNFWTTPGLLNGIGQSRFSVLFDIKLLINVALVFLSALLFAVSYFLLKNLFKWSKKMTPRL